MVGRRRLSLPGGGWAGEPCSDRERSWEHLRWVSGQRCGRNLEITPLPLTRHGNAGAADVIAVKLLFSVRPVMLPYLTAFTLLYFEWNLKCYWNREIFSATTRRFVSAARLLWGSVSGLFTDNYLALAFLLWKATSRDTIKFLKCGFGSFFSSLAKMFPE